MKTEYANNRQMDIFTDIGGAGAVGQVLGMGIGMATAGWQDRRQLRQQGKLQKQQIEGSKQMMDYQQQKQLEMWEKTGYGAQMQQLREAGLNPGLIYGMGGAGGQTIGSQTGSVSGATAPTGAGEMGMGMQLMLQAQLLQAQKELLQSQKNKTDAETQNLGVQTGYTQQLTDNARWDYQLKQIQNRIGQADAYIKEQTIDDLVQQVKAEAAIAVQHKIQELNKTDIALATKQEQIDLVKQEYANRVIEGLLLKANVDLTEGRTAMLSIEARKIFSDMARDWQHLRIEEQEMYIKRYTAKIGAAAIPAYLATEILKTLGGILTVGQLITPTAKDRQIIEGFNPKKQY